DVRTMVSDVGKLGYRILNNFTGDGYVPLPALGWSEVLVDSVEACAVADASDGISQAGTNGIKTPEGRIVAKPGGSVASPVGVYDSRPRRIAGQAQNVFNHVRTTHE